MRKPITDSRLINRHKTREHFRFAILDSRLQSKIANQKSKIICVLCLILILPAFFLNVSLAVGSPDQVFLSFTLDRCVEMALANNEEVLKAQQVLMEAEGALTAARSDQYLQMNFTSWYDRAKDDGKFEAKDYNGTLRAEQLLVRFGELPARLDEAQERYRKAELAVQTAKIDVVNLTRQTFYNIILIQDEMKEREVLRDEIEKKRLRTEERVQKKLAVETGYWPLYRYDPRLKEEGKNPLILDSKEPKGDFKEFLMGEIRYSSLTRTFPDRAKELFDAAEKDMKERYLRYKRLASD